MINFCLCSMRMLMLVTIKNNSASCVILADLFIQHTQPDSAQQLFILR